MSGSGQRIVSRRRRLPTVPGVYLFLLCEVLRRMGHDDAHLLDGLDVDRASLTQPDSRVSVVTCGIALERALALAGDEGLGLEYGRALRVTLHGSLGMALLSSLSLAEALELGRRYVTLRAPFLRLDYRVEGETSIVEVRPRVELGNKTAFIMETIMLALAYAAEQILGRQVREHEIWMQGEEPAYYARFREQLPVALLYGKPACQMRGPKALLDASPALADPIAMQQASARLEQELEEQEGGQENLVSHVRQQLRAAPEALPTLEAVAASLFMSSRTLKRRLQDLNQSFRELADEELKGRACQLLEETELPVSEVAWRLGYGDVSNFGRAFKRWTGLSPKDYRNGKR